MKKYYIYDKDERNYQQYTFEQVKEFFNIEDDTIKDIDDVEEYLKKEADGMAVPWTIEEVQD
ncbi:MAG: hypothetical protein IJ535_03650 [Pseudobutyrivibrio sp.]|uniref:hypothetical protein n=1 Tax=Pseudobutyrivibrio sp. TaxID=2014367 RepID=UPI0025DD4954|nr:hypothetical protein [Pseudobutyrivibrio sp.]MBQ8488858.1 hypothetical protein [Pseudobutyrivibrio sp.]